MELASRIGNNEEDIRRIEASIYEVSGQLHTLIAEQRFLAEKVDHIGNKFSALGMEFKISKEKIDAIDLYNQFKREYIDTLFSYVKIGAVVVPFLMGIIGYMAYDWGLYKPIPRIEQQK